jgi:hypothetical protein
MPLPRMLNLGSYDASGFAAVSAAGHEPRTKNDHTICLTTPAVVQLTAQEHNTRDCVNPTHKIAAFILTESGRGGQRHA